MNGLLSLALATQTVLADETGLYRYKHPERRELFAFWHRFECEIHEQRAQINMLINAGHRG